MHSREHCKGRHGIRRDTGRRTPVDCESVERYDGTMELLPDPPLKHRWERTVQAPRHGFRPPLDSISQAECRGFDPRHPLHSRSGECAQHVPCAARSVRPRVSPRTRKNAGSASASGGSVSRKRAPLPAWAWAKGGVGGPGRVDLPGAEWICGRRRVGRIAAAIRRCMAYKNSPSLGIWGRWPVSCILVPVEGLIPDDQPYSCHDVMKRRVMRL